jgi:threonylcarbamoyladenosine tRNA methylthiotransferase MtaB
MKRFKIITLGCRTNQYESALLENQLEFAGFSKDKGGNFDICIVNSCAVTHQAEKRSQNAVKKLQKENPSAQIFVTGCLAERESNYWGEGVQIVASKEELINKFLPSTKPIEQIHHFDHHFRAFIKIQDGCNAFCSYCIVPHLRGRSRSRDFQQIVAEVKALVENGYLEVVLTGINVGDFTGGVASLIVELEKIPNLKRIRLSSIDLQYVGKEIEELLLTSQKFCPHLHIPLQGGSNSVLKRMGRHYTIEEYILRLKQLAKMRSDLTFATDAIVGFPGETTQDFENLLQVIHELSFIKVHVFPYSPRANTPAASFSEQLSPNVVKERSRLACEASAKVAFSKREEFVGKEVEILVEGKRVLQNLLGHTANFIPAYVAARKTLPGKIIKAKVIKNSYEGLLCELK